MKKKLTFLLCLALLLLVFSGCASNEKSEKSVIAVSIVPEATFVKEVAGDKFEVVTMIPSGASPETYEPSPKDMAALSNAELYFAIGVPAEDSILKNLNSNTSLISLHLKTAEKYPDLTLDGGRDPHIWLCPERAEYIVNIIADTLAELDPENLNLYKQNAQNYINKIKATAKNAADILTKSGVKDFFVFHPSFQYYAEYFSLNMYSLEKHGKEATPKHLTEMIDLAKEKGAKAVFYQAEASSRQAESFAEEIGGKAVKLEPLSAQYCENLIKMAKTIAGE